MGGMCSISVLRIMGICCTRPSCEKNMLAIDFLSTTGNIIFQVAKRKDRSRIAMNTKVDGTWQHQVSYDEVARSSFSGPWLMEFRNNGNSWNIRAISVITNMNNEYTFSFDCGLNEPVRSVRISSNVDCALYSVA